MQNILYIAHHGIQGQKWGVRRYQNPDGSLTREGLIRYNKKEAKHVAKIASNVITGVRVATGLSAAPAIISQLAPYGASFVAGGLLGVAVGALVGGAIVKGASWVATYGIARLSQKVGLERAVKKDPDLLNKIDKQEQLKQKNAVTA